MSDIHIAITDALKRLGPSSPRRLLDKIGGTAAKLGYQLKKMLATGEVVATGGTKNRVYSLPGQSSTPSAPPPTKRRKKPMPGKRQTARTRTPRAARPAAPPTFIAAITARREIVLIDGTPTPRVLTREQSREVADLVLDNYEAS